MFEADGDPPDIDTGSDQGTDDSPPDIDAGGGDNTGGDMPPDLSMDDVGSDDGGFDDQSFGDDGGFGDEGGEDQNSEDTPDEENPDNLNLSEKISAIMNNQLYQRYLSMLNSIGISISQLTDNGDVLFSLMKDGYTDLLNRFKKLNENVRLWMKNNFVNMDYSKNLLFFNMCINLLNLLNKRFQEKMKKGVKEYSAE